MPATSRCAARTRSPTAPAASCVGTSYPILKRSRRISRPSESGIVVSMLPAAPSGTNSCPTIEVSYRNVTNIYFRAVAYDWNLFLQKNHSRPEYLNDVERQELIAQSPTFQWSAQLPPTADFKERTATLDAPGQLKAGFYFLIASTEPGFSGNDNPITYTDIWV